MVSSNDFVSPLAIAKLMRHDVATERRLFDSEKRLLDLAPAGLSHLERVSSTLKTESEKIEIRIRNSIWQKL